MVEVRRYGEMSPQINKERMRKLKAKKSVWVGMTRDRAQALVRERKKQNEYPDSW
jgi:hypothetical protein